MPRTEDHAQAKSAKNGAVASVGRLELYATVFVTGAIVMTIEVVGTRIVGPVFGVGLFVWSALLAVTLGALATGYYAGGLLADRRSDPRVLGVVVGAAGVLLALVPLITRSVLAASQGLGPRGGPLLSAVVLFAPSLAALGMTGPIAVKLATKTLQAAGRSLGAVYAVSTAGSLVATLVVGFVLIPAFDAHTILTAAAVLLLAFGALSLVRRGRPAALALLLWPFMLGERGPAALPPGITVVDKSQSLLGLVEVILDENRGVRFLRSDHSLLGAQFEADGSSAFGFVNVLEAMRFFRPEAKTALAIGLGTGEAPNALGRHGLSVDVVEIDPAVVHFAHKYFGFSATGEVHVDDARSFLQQTQRRYDLIIHDTFTGGTTPEHLLSVEVLQRVRAVLRPNGVLALNFVGFHQGEAAEASFAVARTIRAIFGTVRAFRDSAPDPTKPIGNTIFFASDGPLEFHIPEGTRFNNEISEQIQRGFVTWPTLQSVHEGPLITDAKNPLGRLQIPVAEQHFTAMNELLPLEVWLN